MFGRREQPIARRIYQIDLEKEEKPTTVIAERMHTKSTTGGFEYTVFYLGDVAIASFPSKRVRGVISYRYQAD